MNSFRLAIALLAAISYSAHALDFEEDDRVVLLGDTFIERDHHHGHLEAALTLGAAETGGVTFRNLAWSGDTPFGHARSYFGPPQEGLERLSVIIADWKPTVAVLCYGSQLAFPDPETDVPTFLEGYRALLDLLETQSPGIRFVVLSPPPLENLGGDFPDQTENNTRLSAIASDLAAMATERGTDFVDLFSKILPAEEKHTDNGVHLTESGYAVAATTLAAELDLVPYVPTTSEELRSAIVEKNAHAFAQIRPTNETYIRGFRKHEQGQNAAELPQFTPLIEEAEMKIEKLPNR